MTAPDPLSEPTPGLDEIEHEPGVIPELRQDRMVRLAKELLILGVSSKQVTRLLGYDLDRVEQQLAWLPLRNPRKPASLIVAAIDQDFEAPAALWEAHE
ncbi:MAG: hypothetical protein BGO01_08585 [Armatimonadetes bacterium 55-13]|nr:hypothetical protein [Armatimonadota bacterium]OJU62523.1 MAG: hypothetical protein BGO01_08585 [Armatimonadetes bacterium 55-13]